MACSDDIDGAHPDGPMVHVQRQVVHDGSFLAYALPKGGSDEDPKYRWVELTDDVAIPCASTCRSTRRSR